MITQHCKNPDCNEVFPLDADHRFGGYCSAECARERLRSTSRMPNARTWGKPNTSIPVLGKPPVNRIHGADRKKVSGE